MHEDWTQAEVATIINDYFSMLELELKKQPYNKTSHRKNLLPLLNSRSKGSVEFKHQNISAVLAAMGLPYIKGYKPRSNYQQMLEEQVAAFLSMQENNLEGSFETFASSSAITKPYDQINFDTLLDDEPFTSQLKESKPAYRPIKINYLEKEQNNRTLGEDGERLVMEYEKWRLIKAGKENLADKIEWISKDKGDGAGFDILSKNNNGSDRFVEVKTTKLTKETPIYLTKNEISFALLNAENFYLYRVFNFGKDPQLFIKNGQYDNFCTLLPQTFKGYF
jgi:type II secretory pathway pseudopilin PulG